ncbi:Uncharacterized protein APZ42_026133 [Daphnia magna]|uniref:Uncharacterized protein n=1 Tax=Daphnia magna TaxID=35525 RepID=A0A162DBR1_9CRUS|nr:Uncharacterized protein APZ42_026133 [Daphnia magna]
MDSSISKVFRYANGHQSVQYLLHYVGYEVPEWTDWSNSNCSNCRSLINRYLKPNFWCVTRVMETRVITPESWVS